MNWYYVRSEIDGKSVWIKKTKAPEDPAQPNKLQIIEEVIDGPISLDPKDFQEHDIVEVTHHPPIEPGNCLPFEEFLEMLKDLPIQPFKPYVFFNEYAGGMIEVIWEDVGYYVSYPESNTGGHLALCKSFEDDRIVGVKIENLAKLKLQANPD